MTTKALAGNLKVADEVFIATALLHRENRGRVDFTIGEIAARAQRENLFGNSAPVSGSMLRFSVLRTGPRVQANTGCSMQLAIARGASSVRATKCTPKEPERSGQRRKRCRHVTAS